MRLRTRWPALAVAGLLALAVPGLGTAAAPAAHAATGTCNTGTGSIDDFDHDGTADVVVGIPGETLDGVQGAGRAEVHYGDGTVQGLRLPEPGANDQFGFSIATFGFSGGPCDGLLIGAPGRTVDGHDGAGAVAVFRADPDHPDGRPGYRETLDQGDLGGAVQEGAGFGFALVSGDGTPTADQAEAMYIGAPGTVVGGAQDAGAVVRVVFADGGNGQLDTSSSEQWTEGAAPIGGTAAANDGFGNSIGADGVVIAAAGTTVGGHKNAGAVYVRLADRSYRAVTQDTEGVPGVVEAGDEFGATVAAGHENGVGAIAVGAPGEAIGTATAAGSVTELYQVTATGPVPAKGWSQGKNGIPGTPERGDQLGYALTYVPGGLLMGVPGEDVGTVRDAGAVDRAPNGTNKALAWSENTAGVPGGTETGDVFGAMLGSYAGRALVGVPGEDDDAGIVIDGLPGPDRAPAGVHQTTGAAESGDQFGFAVSPGSS